MVYYPMKWRFLLLLTMLFMSNGNPVFASSIDCATTDTPAAATNKMAAEKSPYLRLHKDDPVHWRAWGPDAMCEAERTGKLVFLSIGYFACHWCHVMQKDNFMNPNTAAFMNDRFVNILVDREERPGIDEAYQVAASAIGAPTGWPLNLVLTPRGKPLYGGTYFPPLRRQGVPGFIEMLNFVQRSYDQNKADLTARANDVYEMLKHPLQPDGDGKPQLTFDILNKAGKDLLAQTDPFDGGFGSSVKFPNLPGLTMLWRRYLRTGEAAYRDVVIKSLVAMRQGALFDHIGGGFARYAVDPAWAVPHFEKMLDSNAQFLALMTRVWRETKSPTLANDIRETATFLLRDMRLENGAFASSLDSDSLDRNGVLREGAYYIWTATEIDRVLGADAPLFRHAYGVTKSGNWSTNAAVESGWEDANLLTRRHVTTEDLARAHKLSPSEIEPWMKKARILLATARRGRAKPKRNDAVLADWNGLVIAALIEAGAALDEPAWVDAAHAAFAFVVNTMNKDGALRHIWYGANGGAPGPPGLLSDYAQMGNAALTLFEYTGDTAYSDHAIAWSARLDDFRDPTHGAFRNTTARNTIAPSVLIGYDDQTPSGNATAAALFARLYYFGGADDNRKFAAGVIDAFLLDATEDPLAFSGLLNAADTLLGAMQIVVIGDRNATETLALRDTVWRTGLPGRIFTMLTDTSALTRDHPAFGKTKLDGRATAYVCVGTFCSLPIIEPKNLIINLRELRKEN
jgi:uncharacterized protein